MKRAITKTNAEHQSQIQMQTENSMEIRHADLTIRISDY